MAIHNFWEGLFPVKRDFYKMINDQAMATTKGVEKLHNWLNSRSEEDYQLLFSQADEADKIRFNMENNLIEAFSTPFDRQDIYSLSVEMARIFEYAKSTLKEMEAFAVSTDPTILNMVQQLNVGTDQFAEAMGLLKEDPLESQIKMVNIRKAQLTIEKEYQAGMVELFRSTDLIYAMKYREVYHHIKDAAVHLGYTTDVLHRIVIRMI
ncbi:DUF47 domain-containing protein [Sporomusa sp. KB1]|uniref:DUF47 domain-containing protein n=1 Tax=Sporomusa sp. KB1 TaxID=943346 RepID=UPI0011A14BA4|nr:DUF47 family protein [Sporomusa sp. KB1]TWH47742.1 hypothetical protein Salpa_3823 [Sporomusa sp. KB1]